MEAEKIKSVRAKLNLNQEDFAELIDVSKRSIANYESGYSKPNQRTLLKLTSVDWKITEAEVKGFDPLSFIKMKAKMSKDSLKEMINREKEFGYLSTLSNNNSEITIDEKPVTRSEINEINRKINSIQEDLLMLFRRSLKDMD